MIGSNFMANMGEEIAMILFGIGFANLLLQKNLIKKIIGLNNVSYTHLDVYKRQEQGGRL